MPSGEHSCRMWTRNQYRENGMAPLGAPNLSQQQQQTLVSLPRMGYRKNRVRLMMQRNAVAQISEISTKLYRAPLFSFPFHSDDFFGRLINEKFWLIKQKVREKEEKV